MLIKWVVEKVVDLALPLDRNFELNFSLLVISGTVCITYITLFVVIFTHFE